MSTAAGLDHSMMQHSRTASHDLTHTTDWGIPQAKTVSDWPCRWIDTFE